MSRRRHTHYEGPPPPRGPDLFTLPQGTPARARFTDPQTSHDAAAALQPDTIDWEIYRELDVVRSIWEVTQRLPHRAATSVSPRFKRLEEAGWIRRVGVVQNPHTHRAQTIWGRAR